MTHHEVEAIFSPSPDQVKAARRAELAAMSPDERAESLILRGNPDATDEPTGELIFKVKGKSSPVCTVTHRGVARHLYANAKD